MKNLGLHVLLDLGGCPPESLHDRDLLARILREAAAAAGATIVGELFHRFAPVGVSGVSGVLLIAESHVSIHTWPEHGAAALDIYTCGDSFDADAAATLLERALGATQVQRTRVRRGIERTASSPRVA